VDGLAAVAERTGGAVVPADLADRAQVDGLISRIEAEHGPVDVLVNNAGIIRPSLVTKTDVRVWEEHLKVNLTGAFLCSLKVLPGMISRGWGRIINVSSVYGMRGQPHMAAYGASKAGLIGFTKSLATEVGSNGVTVNAICPGFVDSPMMASAVSAIVEKSEQGSGDLRELLIGRSPQKRAFTVEEVAEAISFFATEGAKGVNGQTLVLDGGELAS
jgi:NAD(P)-dependent dehydrogenase (short-subunit alcohol dehydrogenase family)